MQDFLRPKQMSTLFSASRSKAVVIINIHPSSCNALVLPPACKNVGNVPLPGFSTQKASAMYNQLADSLRSQGRSSRGFRIATKDGKEAFGYILSTLWYDVTKPVLDFLGYTEKMPLEDLPHIVWCTTGLLSFLPLHAAGDYSKSDCALFDYAISSYTPTLDAIISRSPPPTEFSSILAVGQASTSGFMPLPGTVSELNCIKQQGINLPYTQLDGESATTNAVLGAMENHGWVHFACHASQNLSEPTKSAFHLHDGPLDLAVITRKPLKYAQLAFLSACQTATGDRNLPEEAVHLAAGMLMAGYPTVIATMWSINDNDAPVVAEAFYEYMLKDGDPDARKAARALHTAVGDLRTKVGVKAFGRWAPYIHVGQ